MTQTPPHTPALRFPEFRGAGAWEVKKLKEVCEINPSTKKLPEDFFYIDLGAVNSGNLISKKKLHCDSAPSRAQRLLKSGDIIYQVVRPYQRNNFLCNFDDKDNYVASTGYAQLRALDSNNFLYQLIHTDSFVNIVISKCTGSNYPAISSSDLSEINISIPPLAEQEKIAGCLSSLDELITAHGDRLDGLKDYKRGLMQQLFPAKGQTTPTLRFPDFQGKDPWQEKRLVEVCSKIPQGGTPSTTKPDYWNGSINWLTPAEMGKTKDRFMHTTVRKITELGLKKCSSDLLPINSIIVSTRAPIGYLTINKTEMAFNQGCKGLVPNKTTSYDFLYYILLFYKNSLIDLGSGSTFKELTGNNLKNFKVTFPSLEEQQKIADCLSAMDELITAQADKIETLKTYKKGLMQQLFPQL